MHRLLISKVAIAALLILQGCTAVDEHTILISGASVIEPSTNELLENACIWITGQRIVDVRPCTSAASAALVIDAQGKWIIPGLWDMHVHSLWHRSIYQNFFPQFVAFGVVGIRDMGGDVAVLAEAREFLANPDNIGPEIIAAGPFLDGPQPIIPEFSLSAATFQEGVDAVTDIAAQGADFIKLYTNLPAEAARGALTEARARGLTVAGHLPASIDLNTAIEYGMSSIEHMAVEAGGLCDVDDVPACRRDFERLKTANVYLTPTLLVRQRRTILDDPDVVDRARMNAMPDIIVADWTTRRDQKLSNLLASDWSALRSQYVRERRLTEIAIAADSLILAGTDTGDLFVPPGASLHDELALLVDAGMTEMSALLAATARATEFLKLADRGHIRSGDIADLIVLNSSPIENIRNTRDIDAVILRGKVLSAAMLARMREPDNLGTTCRHESP